jgi:hypothetical protein
MKTKVTLKHRSSPEQILENIRDFGFKLYCYFQTLIKHPTQLGKAYWSKSDCYIIIGKAGYISNGKIYDINGDITPIRELIINEKNPIKIFFSEQELTKIEKIANEKHISIKDLLIMAINKLKTNE